MMYRLLCLSGLSLSIGCQKVDLKEFSPDGTFKVLMPENRQQKEEYVGGAPAKIWQAEFQEGALFVAVSGAISPSLTELQTEKLLQLYQERLLEDYNAQLVNQSEAKLGDSLGRQLEARLRIPKISGGGDVEGILKNRVYVADGRIFTLLAIGRPEWMSAPEIDRFLDSLQITK